MRKNGRESSDPYYDLIEDFDLIASSFQTQYGIRLSRDLRGMKWNEFKALLIGIGAETPLGRIVSIRAEEDKEVLKHFTKDQHRIRNEWKSKRAKELAKRMTEADMNAVMEQFKQMFIQMAGTEGGKEN